MRGIRILEPCLAVTLKTSRLPDATNECALIENTKHRVDLNGKCNAGDSRKPICICGV